MKVLRVTALGLVVAACLVAMAPAAQAADDGPRSGRVVVGGSGGWLVELMERVGGWLGWGDDEPRPVPEAVRGDCTGGLDPSGGSCPAPPPVPLGDGDCTGGLDPNGGPCKP